MCQTITKNEAEEMISSTEVEGDKIKELLKKVENDFDILYDTVDELSMDKNETEETRKNFKDHILILYEQVNDQIEVPQYSDQYYCDKIKESNSESEKECVYANKCSDGREKMVTWTNPPCTTTDQERTLKASNKNVLSRRKSSAFKKTKTKLIIKNELNFKNGIKTQRSQNTEPSKYFKNERLPLNRTIKVPNKQNVAGFSVYDTNNIRRKSTKNTASESVILSNSRNKNQMNKFSNNNETQTQQRCNRKIMATNAMTPEKPDKSYKYLIDKKIKFKWGRKDVKQLQAANKQAKKQELLKVYFPKLNPERNIECKYSFKILSTEHKEILEVLNKAECWESSDTDDFTKINLP